MQAGNTKLTTTVILSGLFIFAVILMIWPSYQLLVKPRGQAFDLFWIWAGGRAVLAGDNPYGPETTRLIQLGVFKKIIPPDQYQHGFPQPPHITFILLPFIILPFSWSILLWVSLQIPLFMVTLLLGFHLLKWSPRPYILLSLTLLTILGFRYPINVYVLGQLTFFIIFCLLLALWLWQKERPRWAALALACATIRPDLSLLAILLSFILMRPSPQRKHFVITLLGVGLILALLPTFFIGFWPVLWLQALQSYGPNPFATWPPSLIPWFWLRVVLLLGLTLWVGYYGWLAWHQPTLYAQALLISALVLFGLIVLLQTGSYNLTFVLIPALICLRYASQRWLQLTIAVSLLLPWFYFWLGPPFDTLIFLLIPGQFILFHEIVRLTMPQEIRD